MLLAQLNSDLETVGEICALLRLLAPVAENSGEIRDFLKEGIKRCLDKEVCTLAYLVIVKFVEVFPVAGLVNLDRFAVRYGKGQTVGVSVEVPRSAPRHRQVKFRRQNLPYRDAGGSCGRSGRISCD